MTKKYEDCVSFDINVDPENSVTITRSNIEVTMNKEKTMLEESWVTCPTKTFKVGDTILVRAGHTRYESKIKTISNKTITYGNGARMSIKKLAESNWDTDEEKIQLNRKQIELDWYCY